jgi:hypothetical protein
MKARVSDSAACRFTFLLFAAFASNTFAGVAWAAASSPTDGTPGVLTDATAVNQAADELVEHHRHHHHGGVTKFIAMALDTLGVAPAKQARVDKIQTELYQCMVPARDLENGLLLGLADGVAAGQVDVSKADATIGQLDASATAVHACTVDPLNRLHAALSSNERATLIDKVQSHWHVWRRVNMEAESGSRDKGSQLAELTKELSLTPEQGDKISSALQTALAPLSDKFDPKRVDAHLEAFSSAFLQKSFDAKKLTANASGHLATYGAQRMAVFYETVTPPLTPEQRALLAQHLREHASLQLAASEK